MEDRGLSKINLKIKAVIRHILEQSLAFIWFTLAQEHQTLLHIQGTILPTPILQKVKASCETKLFII